MQTTKVDFHLRQYIYKTIVNCSKTSSTRSPDVITVQVRLHYRIQVAISTENDSFSIGRIHLTHNLSIIFNILH